MNSKIKHYKNQYFQLMEKLTEEGRIFEVGNWLKKNRIGNKVTILSNEGYKSCEYLKWCWFRYYNFNEGIELLNDGYEYVFFKNNYHSISYDKFLSVIDGLNYGESRKWYNKFYHSVLSDIIKNKRSCLVLDINDSNYSHTLNIKRDRVSKKYITTYFDNNRLNDLIIDYKERDRDKVKKFIDDRNEIMGYLDEWYNIGSKWLFKKINKK